MMTLEEYRQLAMNPPEQWENSLFVVECVTIDELEERHRQHYPLYKVSRGKKVFCRNLEEATACVKRLVEENEKDDEEYRDEVFCYYMWELPWGKEFAHEGEYDYSWRIYDVAGKLIDRNVCMGYYWELEGAREILFDQIRDKRDEPLTILEPVPLTKEDTYWQYRGRDRETLRFKEGDIVEVMQDEEVELAMVVSLPPTIECLWERAKRYVEMDRRRDNESGLSEERLSDDMICCMNADDEIGDCYSVVTISDNSGYMDVFSRYIFAPHFPVPNYMRKKLENSYRICQKRWEES